MTASHPFFRDRDLQVPDAQCRAHGERLAPLLWPDEDRRCTGCGHRFDPDGPVLQTRELPARYWLTEHANRYRARRYRQSAAYRRE